MRLDRYENVRVLAVLLALLLVGGCGDDSGTSTTPVTTTTVAATTTTTVPARANITLTIERPELWVTTQGNVFWVDLTIRETAGVGVSLNFFRLELFAATGAFVERQERGAGWIIAEYGSNRVEASSTRMMADVAFVFRTHIAKGRTMRFTVGYGDDSGYANQTESVDFIFR